jgi:GT2 family glycosyltransferase
MEWGVTPEIQFTTVVPTRGDPDALARISRHIAPHVDSLLVVVNDPHGPDVARWKTIVESCSAARYVCAQGGGVSRARNLALRVVDSDVVVFLDDDVTASAESFTALTQPFEDHRTGVVTGRVIPAEREGGTIYSDFIGLDRGTGAQTYTKADLSTLTITDCWKLGVGAAFAIHLRRLKDVESPPAFDEALSNGRFCGGAEDIDFFLQCLHAGIGLSYCPRAVFGHLYPDGDREAARKMRQYARADGAFYAKWAASLADGELRGDWAYWLKRLNEQVPRALRGLPHLPLGALAMEPFHKLVGALWWRLSLSR